MTGEELFRVWAPPGVVWSNWAKPVLFAQMRRSDPAGEPQPQQDLSWAPSATENVALILDLPGVDSVRMGVGLAGVGYRPIPLFNGVAGEWSYPPTSLIDLGPTQEALAALTPVLQSQALVPEAPPVFLLDSRRLPPYGAAPGRFDNRWAVFPQDFPSGNFMRSRRVQRAILVQQGQTPKDDLTHVLLRWQSAGIQLELGDISTGSPLVPLQLRTPSRFRSLFYRAMVLAGLRRNSAGGFGGTVPVPSSGG